MGTYQNWHRWLQLDFLMHPVLVFRTERPCFKEVLFQLVLLLVQVHEKV